MEILAIGLLSIILINSIETKNIEKTNIHREWENHKLTYNLDFEETENLKRKSIFEKNLKFIQEYNAKNNGMVLGMNQFGHLESHEIPKGYQAPKKDNKAKTNEHTYGQLPLPQKVDWRENGYVSPVKNQGQCGSCYSFSALDAIESRYAIDTGEPIVELSEQEIIDCAAEFGNLGCDGGLIDGVFKYVEKYGISRASDYKYQELTGPCNSKKFKHLTRTFTHYDVPYPDESALIRAVAFGGPVSIGIDSATSEFSFYKSGIFISDNCSKTRLDHAVLAVGYSNTSQPYLIVKNSWGDNWGENGYIRMALFRDNQCGIATDASYPISKL